QAAALPGGRRGLARAARRAVPRDPRTLQPADRAADREDRPGEGSGVDRQGRPTVDHGATAPGERQGRVSDRLVVIGAIARTHGLAGEVRVTPMTDDPERFGRVRECVLWDTAHDRRERYRITGTRRQGAAIVMTLEGCASPEAAAALVGRLVALPEDEALPPGPGRFYPWQLEGCRVLAEGRHRITDDYQFGGGGGMVLKPEPLFAAVDALRTPGARAILMDPRGRTFTQAVATELARETHLILLAGRYEGVDARVSERLADDSISIGDYVLTGGELPALVVTDAVAGLLPGVLGAEGATERESFASGLLEPPQYTRPAEFRGARV